MPDRRRTLTLIALSAAVGTITPGAGRSAASADPVTVKVQGSPLANITTSSPALTPAFSSSTTDYVLRCQAGANPIDITFTASSGGTVQLGSQSGSQVTASVTLVENQALVVDAGGLRPYWIRCLPHDFPQLQITKPGSPPPGWYLTGNVGVANGSGTYAMILDQNGTPVWYQKTAGQGAIDVTPLAPNTVAWNSDPGPGFGTDPRGAFSVFDLATQSTVRLKTPEGPLDLHELLPLPNGVRLMLATPLRAGVDLRWLGFGTNRTIVDCLIEEVNQAGQLVWKWRASDHISVRESFHPFPVIVDRQNEYDVFHCNSVDEDPRTGDVLLSLRHTDAVYRIDKASGSILWKLGGNSVGGDREQHLRVQHDPERTFHGQHDARFEPNGDISLYDNHTWSLGAARGVEYHVDARAGTATLVWQYAAPDGRHSNATGSFRRYVEGNDNVVTWGFKPYTLFTEVDAAGNVLLNATFPNGEAPYRTIKAPTSEFDVNLLHQTAGLVAAFFPPAPRVLSVGPAIGRTSGGTAVTITGSGFTGATVVKFGATNASSFSVNSDISISAVAPAGSGRASVRVTTPGGTSATRPHNILEGSDATFTTGTGSWSPNVNATVSLSRANVRSRNYSLKITPKTRGFSSALTSGYAVPANARVTGSVWVKTALGREHVRSALVFQDEGGSVLSIAQGRFLPVSARWTQVTVIGTSPTGTAMVALAVDDADGHSSLYLDDASLTGSGRFVYKRLPPTVSSMIPNHGSAGTVVTITGGGFTGATAVRFGSARARTFTVDNDSSITAVAPPGSEVVAVSVTTPVGTSLIKRPNLLSAADSTFEGGTGSWASNANASVSLSSRRARTGNNSLKISPLASGFDSALTGPYPVAAGAEYDATVWVATPGATAHVFPFLIFYGPGGVILSIEQGPTFRKTSASGWIRLTLATLSPEGATSVAVGVDNADGTADLYLDDVALTGSVRFTYA